MIYLQADWIAMNYVPFAENVTKMVVRLYQNTAKHPVVIKGAVLEKIIKVCIATKCPVVKKCPVFEKLLSYGLVFFLQFFIKIELKMKTYSHVCILCIFKNCFQFF